MWNPHSPFANRSSTSSALDSLGIPSSSERDPARSVLNLRRRSSHEVKTIDLSAPTPPPDIMHPRARALRPNKRLLRRWLFYLVLCVIGWSGLTRLNESHREALEDTLLSSRDAIAGRLASAGMINWRPQTCHFVSPVEAYYEDLRRLRELVADQEGFDISFPANISQLADIPHSHVFSPTGHLVISDEPGQPHPIPVLVAKGEAQWRTLRARQSKNLGEAVEEYQRRYGRKPPRGFDIWWRAVEEHKTVMPDEYDRINVDLAPFFALPKAEMKRRLETVQLMKETFTVEVKDGQVSVQIRDEGGLEWAGTMVRAKDAGSLINAFAHYLPDLNATFSIFDQPQIYLSWARRASLASLGLKNQHTQHVEEYDSGDVQLSRSCPPESNLRTKPDMREGRSFVYDTLAAGDLCQNPYIVPAHGLTIEPHTQDSHPRPHTRLLPLFSLAKTSINSDILITPLDQFFDKPGRDPSWARKRSAKLAWRGSPTGISMMSRDLPWRDSHRVRLHTFANDKSQRLVEYITPDLGQEVISYEGDMDVAPDTSYVERDQYWSDLKDPDQPPGVIKERTPFGAAANFFMDVKLAGKPLQCNETDGTCDDLLEEIDWSPHQPSAVLNRHKFLLDVDGNGWSGRFRRLMSTNSLVIKAGIFTEWFQPHLIPWFHYVPAKLDYSDLFDILAFFRGSPYHPDLAFDKTAEALAHNGRCFVQRMFRLEDLQVYMMRLFLEYARLIADEGVDMDFDYEDYRRATSGDLDEEDNTNEGAGQTASNDPNAQDDNDLNVDDELQDLDDQPNREVTRDEAEGTSAGIADMGDPNELEEGENGWQPPEGKDDGDEEDEDEDGVDEDEDGDEDEEEDEEEEDSGGDDEEGDMGVATGDLAFSNENDDSTDIDGVRSRGVEQDADGDEDENEGEDAEDDIQVEATDGQGIRLVFDQY